MLKVKENKRTKKRNRIVVITTTFPSFSETFILNQITRLIDLGYDIRILPKSPQQQTSPAVHPDVRSYKLISRTQYPEVLPRSKWKKVFKVFKPWFLFTVRQPVFSMKLLKANLFCKSGFGFRRLLFSIRLFQKPFDIVHCHFGNNASDIVKLKQAGMKIPLMTSFHGHDINRYPLINGKECYKDLFSAGELFTANTYYTKQRMVEYGCDAQKIHIIHESLYCDKFYTPVRDKTGQIGVKILTVGRMVEKKGFPYSLRAMSILIEKGYPIEYWVVGDGPLLREMKVLAKTLNISKHVHFFGAQTESEVQTFYREADIFILPSVTASDGDKEGQGLVLQEAQMAGLPVVSTFHNGIPEGIVDGKSGFLVPEKNAEALAESVEYLIKHKDLWEQLGRCGQTFVRENFDIPCVVKSLINVYEELLSE